MSNTLQNNARRNGQLNASVVQQRLQQAEEFEQLVRHIQAAHNVPACFDPVPGIEVDVRMLHNAWHCHSDGSVTGFKNVTVQSHDVDDQYFGTL